MAIDPQDLDFFEQEDFTGGLWTWGDIYLMPRNALVQCSDYFPLASGGVRAVPAAQAASVTGISTEASASRYCLGVWSGSEPFPYFTFQWVPSTSTLRLYVLTGYDITAGSWTLAHTYSAATVRRPIDFATLRLTAGPAYRFYYNLDITGGDTPGVYKTDGAGSTSLAFAFTTPSALVSHQARLVLVGQDATSTLTNISYTDVGVDAVPPGVNTIAPLGELPGEIRWMKPAPPSDLIVAKKSTGLVMLQGSISGPPFVRQMTFEDTSSFCRPVMTDRGLAFLSEFGETRLWSGGDSTENIHRPIFGRGNSIALNNTAPANAEQGGKLGYMKPWLFTGAGYIYDTEIRAWHVNTSLAGFYDYHYNDHKAELICAKPGPLTGAGALISYIPMIEEAWTRATGGTIQSSPQPIDDRVPHVREVQLNVRCFGTTSFTVTIGTGTASVEARTITGVAAGAQVLRLPFSAGPISASHFDYTITTSTSGGVEAPIIRKVRVGFAKRQRKAPS